MGYWIRACNHNEAPGSHLPALNRRSRGSKHLSIDLPRDAISGWTAVRGFH